MKTRISAIEYALPARVLSNDELCAQHPEWRMDEVTRHTGVRTRHIAAPGETALDLAEAACTKLLTRTAVELMPVDTLMFCTQTPDHITPPNACLLQARLGLPTSVAAFDFTHGCSGYVYGLFLANSLIASGAARSVLLVTADTSSRFVHPDDRASVTLFGDGAAATLLARTDSAGLREFVLGTDGQHSSSASIPAGGSRLPRSPETSATRVDRSGNRRTQEHFQMDGIEVLAFALREVPRNVHLLLERERATLDDVDLFVFHQASAAIIRYLTRALQIPSAKVFSNLDRVANTGSASIPIALKDAQADGILRPGQTVLLAGFGTGLSWGSCLVDW